MKKTAALSTGYLFCSVFAGHVDRVFVKNEKVIKFPFLDSPTTLNWYADYLGDLCSYSLFMLCLITVMKPVYRHFENMQDTVHHRMFIFTRLWHRLFWVITITSFVDVIHFILAARQIEAVFLIQNIAFLLVTVVLIIKAYSR